MSDEFGYQQRQKELHKKLTIFYEKRYQYKFSKLFQDFWNENIINLCPSLKHGKVIDFGCGTGILFQICSKKYNSIIGIDLSYEMIANAARHYLQIKGCVVGDGCYLPFCDNAVELVVCRSALHHLPDLNKTLLEIKRILKDDGALVFSEPSNDNYLIRVSRFLMYKLSSRFDEKDVAFITSELTQRLEQLAFRIEVIKRFGFLSYLFSGFPDHLPLMIYIPFNVRITKLLILIDKLLAKIPLIKNQSFHIIIRIKKSQNEL